MSDKMCLYSLSRESLRPRLTVELPVVKPVDCTHDCTTSLCLLPSGQVAFLKLYFSLFGEPWNLSDDGKTKLAGSVATPWIEGEIAELKKVMETFKLDEELAARLKNRLVYGTKDSSLNGYVDDEKIMAFQKRTTITSITEALKKFDSNELNELELSNGEKAFLRHAADNFNLTLPTILAVDVKPENIAPDDRVFEPTQNMVQVLDRYGKYSPHELVDTALDILKVNDYGHEPDGSRPYKKIKEHYWDAEFTNNDKALIKRMRDSSGMIDRRLGTKCHFYVDAPPTLGFPSHVITQMVQRFGINREEVEKILIKINIEEMVKKVEPEPQFLVSFGYTEYLPFAWTHPFSLPERQTDGANGFDVFLPHDIKFFKGRKCMPIRIPLGICIKLPHGPFFLRGRSSTPYNGLNVLTGLIDQDFEGELCLSVQKLCIKPLRFKRGDRICQLVPYVSPFKQVTKPRKGCGFGSTG